MRKRIFEVMASAAILFAACVSSNAQIQDRINRGCGGLGGSLVQVLTDFSGNVLITTCTGKGVFINGVLIPSPATIVTGSGTVGTIPLWTPTTTNLGNSILTQTGTSAVTLGAGAFNFTQVAAPSLSAANFGKLYFDSTSKTLKGSYNGAAYFEFLRGNVTNGTLPIANTTGNVFGDSFATQSGTNFSITQGATGAIVLGRLVAGRPNFFVDDGSRTIAARLNTTNYFLVDAGSDLVSVGRVTGAATGQFDASTGTTTLGNLTGPGNSTVTINNPAQTVAASAAGTAVLNLDGTTGKVEFGDLNALANATTVTLIDSASTIQAKIGASYLLLNGGNSTAAIGKASGSAQGLFDGNTGISSIGDTGSQGNSITFKVDDTAQTYTANGLSSCTGLTTTAGGLIGCGTSTLATVIGTGTTASIGGGALIAGACASNTVTITGVAVGDSITANPTTYPGDGNYFLAYRSGANTVTVKVCAAIAGTPTASVYNVRVTR